MKIVKPPFSIRLIYWLTNFAFGIMALVFIAAIAFNIVLYTGLFGDDMQLHTELPVKVDFLEKGNLHLNDQDIKVELVEATTKIHFFNTPDFITRKVAIILLFVIGIGGYLIWTFRTFIKNVKDGLIFDIKNISLLKRLSYALVGVWLLMTIYMQLFYHYIAKHLEFENVVISSNVRDYSDILVLALFIWVLAHIFTTGLRLQHEKDLTI